MGIQLPWFFFHSLADQTSPFVAGSSAVIFRIMSPKPGWETDRLGPVIELPCRKVEDHPGGTQKQWFLRCCTVVLSAILEKPLSHMLHV